MTRRGEMLDAALRAQRELARAVHAAADPAWLHLDLTMGQLKALFALADAATADAADVADAGLTVGRLADLMDISKPTASLLVDRLVGLGLVARAEDADDRRRTRVRLTAEGRDRVARLRQGGEDRWRLLLDRLDDDDLAALTRGLRSLAHVAAADHLTAAS